QILGDSLESIAWEKGGIFKRGGAALTVEQPRGGMGVLQQQCALDVGAHLTVVPPLPLLDSKGAPYVCGLRGEYQRDNAALALELCWAWLITPAATAAAGGGEGEDEVEGRANQKSGDKPGNQRYLRNRERFLSSPYVHDGLRECAWPGRCQVVQPREFPELTLYLDGAHTHQSMHMCLTWFREQ
ncbi:unnamed protein product, partial [Choristocarpus tenellus]